ncbi:MAG: metallophosphoesterase family protein [Promethearchaeota archaeon]|jgi:putative phosphoesterase
MKLAVLADIHGNLPALNAVMEEIEIEGVSHILVAGDILGGPCPVEVIRRLITLNACMIRGNFEDYILKIYSNPSDSNWYMSKQFSPTYWIYKRLNQHLLSFIDSLPEQKIISLHGTDDILMVHSIHPPMLPTDASGTLITDKYNELVDSYTKSMEQSVLIFAHNHVPWNQKINGCLALNPGSTGFPLNGTIGAQYALMEWENDCWEADIRTVHYNIDKINDAFVRSGFLKEGGPLARAILSSVNTGKDMMGIFLRFLYKLAYKEGYRDFEVVPDEILELAEKKWDWNKFNSGKEYFQKN